MRAYQEEYIQAREARAVYSSLYLVQNAPQASCNAGSRLAGIALGSGLRLT